MCGMAVLLPFLKPVYCKARRENKSQAKAQEWVYFGPALKYPRESARVLTCQSRAMSPRNTGHMHHLYLPRRLSSGLRKRVADDVSRSDSSGGGVVDELDNGLAHLNDLDVTWGFDLDAFLQECPK